MLVESWLKELKEFRGGGLRVTGWRGDVVKDG